jgi:hypothetical protein
MNAVGFESKEYWGFVVSDLSRDTTMQIASQLAPSLNATLDAGSESQGRAGLGAFPFTHEAGAQP